MMKKVWCLFIVLCLTLGCVSGLAEQIDTNALFQEARAASQNKDYVKANELFLQLYEAGDPRGAEMLAGSYQRGQGVEKNIEEAIKWNLIAAEEFGGGRGYTNIGQMYENGDGVEQSYDKAVEYYDLSMSPELKNPDFKGARYAGVLYEKGFVNDSGEAVQDYTKAAAYYQVAADHGDVTGNAYLGRAYELGLGVEENKELAVKYYIIAAQSGNVTGVSDAVYALAHLVEKGDGTEQDIPWAIELYQKALEYGIEAAQEDLTRLTGTAEAIIFVHTNDVHGHVDVEPYVKAIADQLKAAGNFVLTISAGDIFAGGEAIAHTTKGEAIVDIMNAAGYDVAAVGNNDIHEGLAWLLHMEEETSFHILCANMVFSEYAGDLGKEGDYPLLPYEVIVTNNGTKIGLFGLTTKNSPPVDPDEEFVKTDSIEAAQKLVDILRNEEKADIVVAVAHAGWPDNDETMTATTATDFNSYQIAMAVEGIDLIIDGHTHSVIGEGKGYTCANESKTLIVQTGCFGDNIGIVTILYEDGILNKKAIQLKAEEYESQYTPDPAVVEIAEKWKADVEARMGTVVGETAVFLNAERAAASPDGRGIRMGEQNLGNLIADAIRWKFGSDISWISGVRIRASIDAGDIKLKDWFNVFANGATICGIRLTGAEVKSYLKQYVASAAEDREAVDFKQISGIRFTYNSAGDITSAVLEDGTELLDEQVYYVVGEFGLSPENADVLLDGDSVLADMMIEFMNSDAYHADRYLEAEGRIIKE